MYMYIVNRGYLGYWVNSGAIIFNCSDFNVWIYPVAVPSAFCSLLRSRLINPLETYMYTAAAQTLIIGWKSPSNLVMIVSHDGMLLYQSDMFLW